jgi:uncharacterized protein
VIAATDRITTIDAVRGVAVMGILLMNIVAFAMPGTAYVDPGYYGGATGANWAVWAFNYVIADGKFRGLFTMLFGASTVLIAERAFASRQNPTGVHLARMFWLFVIGMIHAYLIWYGDILVLYAICGSIAFAVWRLAPRALLTAGLVLLLVQLALGLSTYSAVRALQVSAAQAGASATAIEDWSNIRTQFEPPPAFRDQEIAAYRGGYRDNLAQRVPTAILFQTQLELLSIPDTLALIMIGMALFRLGFFSGAWSMRRYAMIAGIGYAAAIPPDLFLMNQLSQSNFSGVTALAIDAIHLAVLRPPIALAHASVVIMIVRSAIMPNLAERLAAVGRMAISNYVGTSILCTTLFYGFGFGMFGHLERWQLYPIVAAIWVLMLVGSTLWLDHFRYGPLEWLWRSLARWQLQPMRR